jgi:hypothetical protein
VDSPVWVSRLKLLAPELIDALRKTNLVINDCRVRALPEATLDGSGGTEAATFSSLVAADNLLQAADAIADPELATSLRRLAGSLSKRPLPSDTTA